MNDPLTYEYACQLRAEADETGSPDLYRKAADIFDYLGMSAAAERCLERARLYAEQPA